MLPQLLSWFRMGVVLYIQKTTILLTSGPDMTGKLKNECRAWKCILLMLYKDKRMCSPNILLHSTNEQRLYLFAVMQCTCRLCNPPKVAPARQC